MGGVTSDTDDRILLLLSQNDPEAATQLFRSYYRAAYLSARRIVWNKDDAKDVVLELFQAVWERRHSLKITKPIETYLIAAARRRAINYLRRKNRFEKHLESLARTTPVSASPADADLEARELADILRNAIARLPERERRTFQLSRERSMSHKDIAVELKISQRVVEASIGEVLRRLREVVSAYREK